MVRTGLDMYDSFPADMLKYLRNNGKHFNRKACEYAVSLMKKRNQNTGKMERVEPMSKEQVDELLSRFGVQLENKVLYDYVYVANICRSDFFKTSVTDEHKLALFVKDMIDDGDQSDGYIFNRWYADMCHNGMPIEWGDLL